MCTTFNVGSLSALNAVAGAYAHDLPLICIVGNPSSAQIGSWRFIHHSVRSGYDLSQRHIYRETTVDSVAIEHAETAPMLIDRAISSAICHSKPVLIEVCSNLAKAVVPAPNRFPFLSTPASSTHVLEKAVQATTQLLKDVKNAVVIVGSQVRAATAEDAVLRLVQALGCTAASMADSRGVFPEDHSSYIGLYMGKMAIPSSCREQVEAADACIFVGAAFSDTLTTGFSMKVNWAKTIQVGINRVKLPSQEFGAIYMKDFLNALTESIIMTDSSKYGCHQNGVVKVMTELISDQRAADAFNHSNGTVSTLATVTSERSSRTEQENGCHQCHDLPARVLSTRRRTSREGAMLIISVAIQF
ncbi:hypothetical protein CBR_g29373 [Chara braunii]|uniref:pyruvate decarboxylase n=1 Tax=Chara braunii TaxID=69332 RepID=A0A388JWI7_CHABU|nr:hypothetical protein CBR_g29373 [Chara braunii]|eukprot:GBG62174.1 hypothetical protein CBR_g29373 [Chara braunii]